MSDDKKFNPLVSIIIPVYNGSNYVKEAIESALAQTYQNVEVIVINDGSTDDGETDKIIKEYEQQITYICKENSGVSTALNVGIKNMKGEYFSWLSHDDIYSPDKIEKSIEILADMRDKKTVVCCDYVHINKDSQIIHRINNKKTKYIELYVWEEALMKLIKEGSMNGCALLIHKDIFYECGFFDENLRFNQDGFMWSKIFLKGYSLVCIPEVCVKNRIHNQQLTQRRQDIFRKDCEVMSEFLIPEYFKKSTNKWNFILEYTFYNAKYANFSVVKKSYRIIKDSIGLKNRIKVYIWSGYGVIRPLVRKMYYMILKK